MAIAAAKRKVPLDYRLGDTSFSQAVWETESHVVRIHGCAEVPQSMVLSETQFRGLLECSPYIDLLTQTFLHKSVLFLGFSFYDPAIKYVLEQIEKRFGVAPHGRHMAILPADNASELIQKANRLNISVFTGQGVGVIKNKSLRPLWLCSCWLTKSLALFG